MHTRIDHDPLPVDGLNDLTEPEGDDNPILNRLWDRIETVVDRHGPFLRASTTEYHVARSWQPFRPGIDIHRATEGSGAERVILLRFAPGAVLAGHPHSTSEFCLMVEGEIEIAGLPLRQGDSQYIPAGIDHPDIFSRHGAIVLVCGGGE